MESETIKETVMTRTKRVQGLRRSNAAGLHGDKRTKRQRTRGAAKARAIRESE